MGLVSANDPKAPTKRAVRLEEPACLGCGVCVPTCRTGALRLVRREKRVIPPFDTVQRTVVMALERGQLADLLFDDRTLTSHRLLGAVLGAILKLPPVKRALASEQAKSLFLDALVARRADATPTLAGG